MNEVYVKKAKEQVDKMRQLQIENDVYDIQKLQKQKKFEGQSRIINLEVNGVKYYGTTDVVKAVEEKIAREVASYNNMDLDEEATQEEEYFLSLLSPVSLSETEKEELVKETEEEEVKYILDKEVDLDSSLGKTV